MTISCSFGTGGCRSVPRSAGAGSTSRKFSGPASLFSGRRSFTAQDLHFSRRDQRLGSRSNAQLRVAEAAEARRPSDLEDARACPAKVFTRGRQHGVKTGFGGGPSRRAADSAAQAAGCHGSGLDNVQEAERVGHDRVTVGDDVEAGARDAPPRGCPLKAAWHSEAGQARDSCAIMLIRAAAVKRTSRGEACRERAEHGLSGPGAGSLIYLSATRLHRASPRPQPSRDATTAEQLGEGRPITRPRSRAARSRPRALACHVVVLEAGSDRRPTGCGDGTAD